MKRVLFCVALLMLGAIVQMAITGTMYPLEAILYAVPPFFLLAGIVGVWNRKLRKKSRRKRNRSLLLPDRLKRQHHPPPYDRNETPGETFRRLVEEEERETEEDR